MEVVDDGNNRKNVNDAANVVPHQNQKYHIRTYTSNDGSRTAFNGEKETGESIEVSCETVNPVYCHHEAAPFRRNVSAAAKLVEQINDRTSS